MNDKQIASIKNQTDTLADTLLKLKVNSQPTLTQALDSNKQLFEMGKKVKETKDGIIKPLNESIKKVRNLFSPIEEKIETVSLHLKSEIAKYKEKIEIENAKKEEEIMAKIANGEIDEEKASMKLETLDNKLEPIPTRKLKEVIIKDESIIPKKYWAIDMVLLRKDALAGVEIPGVEVGEKEIILNK